MSILDMLNQAQGGQGLRPLAERLGIAESDAQGLAKMLAPAIAQGTKRQVNSGDKKAVLGKIMGQSETRFLDEPARAAEPEGIAQGERFLETVLGSPDARRELTREAAARSGQSEDLVSSFLPALAAMMQGGMQRRVPDESLQGMLGGALGGGGGRSGGGGLMGMLGGLLGGGGAKRGGSQGGGLDMLTSMLDADGDGSALDDVLDRFMGR